MKKKVITGVCGANSYIDNIYFSSQLSNLKIKTSIDLIVLSSEEMDLDLLDAELKQWYRIKSDVRLKKGNFKRKRTYINIFGTISLLYQSKPFNNEYYRPTFLFELHQPDIQMMDQLHSIFIELGISPIVKKIELAWDFYVGYVAGFQEFIEHYLFLKYQRNPSKKRDNTYYTNDLRSSSKGIRVYPRPKDSERKEYVRLELEIHRRKIKDLRITFPIQAHHLDLDYRNFFEFIRLDTEKLYNYMVKKYWKQMGDVNRRRPGFGQLVLRNIESWISCITYEPMMEAVEKLKSKDYGIPGFYRFLVPIVELNMLIQEAADTQRFGLL